MKKKVHYRFQGSPAYSQVLGLLLATSAGKGPPAACSWAPVLVRDLQLAPGPQDLLACAGKGPPAYSRAPGPPS